MSELCYTPIGDLGDGNMVTIAECRKLAGQLTCGCLVGD